jgi:hypothetical protein
MDEGPDIVEGLAADAGATPSRGVEAGELAEGDDAEARQGAVGAGGQIERRNRGIEGRVCGEPVQGRRWG